MFGLGVIFDFNGTMFYDTDKHEKSWQEAIRKITGKNISPKDFKEKIHGRTTQDILKYFLKRDISDEEYQKYSTDKELIYQKLCLEDAEKFKLIKGLPKFLDFLKNHSVPMAIGTAAPKINMDFYEKYFHLSKWFPANRIIYDDGTVKGKPNPDIYLKAAKTLGLPPKKCIIFEDSPMGIEAAANAGAYKIIVLNPFGYSDDARNLPKVSAVIPDFTHAERLIN